MSEMIPIVESQTGKRLMEILPSLNVSTANEERFAEMIGVRTVALDKMSTVTTSKSETRKNLAKFLETEADIKIR
jgi:hypothetical protein